MAKLDPAAFAAWCEQQQKTKCGYLMGAVGQYTKDLTTGSWLVSQYKENKSQYEKAKYWLSHAPRVFDCQGLADCYVSEQTGKKTNVYARGNYSDWCGTKGTGKIPAMYRVPGAAVFIYSSSAGRITHVGFLLRPVSESNPAGDWYVIEAKGVMYGVVRTKLNSGNWNRWGLMTKYFDYDKTEEKDPELELGGRVLKKGMKGADVKILQECLIKIGFELPRFGADGDYGDETFAAVKSFQRASRITADGIYGEDTHAALMDALKDLEEPEDVPAQKAMVFVAQPGTWNVRDKPNTSGRIITVVKQGATFAYVSTADNGWLQIEINGATGWISNKCAEVAE